MHDCFLSFKTSIQDYELPTKFTFPFYYEPHPLCKLATQELQTYLQSQKDWQHDFGLEENETATKSIGKMFGVLLVQKEDGEVGYLAAFSGKLANKNVLAPFVPPVFDRLTEDSFFLKGEAEISDINQKLKKLETSDNYIEIKEKLKKKEVAYKEMLINKKITLQEAKKKRDILREGLKSNPNKEEVEKANQILNEQSARMDRLFREKKKIMQAQLKVAQGIVDLYEEGMDTLKQLRKQKSADLQRQLFEQYTFLNQAREEKSLYAIFQEAIGQFPPSGAGACAAPKLLQYAFQHDLKPLALAEFWWGKSPKSAIRKHQYFYPVCRNKCEPILAQMLQGIALDDDPIQSQLETGGQIVEVFFENELLAAINKPVNILAVPGKKVQDSVWARMKQKYPEATGPLIVHRLDMSTSGIMLIPKTKEAHKMLQKQFADRTIKKRYVALLNGIIEGEEGVIDLPLRVDLEDRPRQLVCYKHGKSAQTKWKVIARKNGQTRVHFFPITGRTHQLRVHAAHHDGLNCPIVGDGLYGIKADRLYLHAEQITFIDPLTNELLTLNIPVSF